MDGNFGFSEGLRLDGGLTGNILGQADRPSILVISESAVVIGEVQADHIIINGPVSYTHLDVYKRQGYRHK